VTAKRLDPLLPVLRLGIAAAAALLVGAGLLALLGENPWSCYIIVTRHLLRSPVGWASILYRTTLLTFVGLAVAIPFRAGLFNIGAEGQLYMGALFCLLAAFSAAKFPRWIALPWCLLAGALGGSLWALIPALLKTRRGVHEVIGTILTNLCAIALINYLTTGPMKDPGTGTVLQMIPQTRAVPEVCHLPSLTELWPGLLGGASHPLNVSILLSLLLVAIAALLMSRTRLGLLWKALGRNESAVRLAGARVERLKLGCFALAGAMAGLVCSSEILGHQHRLVDNFSGGLGFQGIAVALLARNHPLAIPVSALVFGILQKASSVLDVRTSAPKEIGLLIQGVLLLVLLCVDRRRGGKDA